MRRLMAAPAAIFFTIIAAPAAAQMAVTTLGAGDGAKCYENANNALSDSTAPCDRAVRDALTTRSDLKKTFVNRGIIHNRNGDFEAAFEDFNAALSIDPDLAEAYLNRGNSHFQRARYEEALADYERALALDVAKPWAAWYNIGLVHDAKKDPAQARAAYEKALDLNPDFILAQQKLAPSKLD